DGTLGALRALCAGRKTAATVAHVERFMEAVATANFTAFLFCGEALDGPGLEMLQGLISDINLRRRASALHLPASESGWGSTLVSGWMTGFPLRIGFSRGFPDFDPWRWHVARMIEDGEADLHLWV